MKLIVEGITKTFDKQTVLDEVSFEFERGKIYGLLGKNGAGKTTLFNCINDDLKTDSGSFFLLDKEARRPLSAADIGYVLSTPVVPDFLTAREFLKYFIDINSDKITDLLTIDEYFNIVSIEEKDRNKLLKDFSHGMKNKMQMLVNILIKPPVLLLDEPLTSFDIVVAEEMKNLLRTIKKDGIIIFSTHIMELAFDLCDEIVLLNDGKLTLINDDVNSNAELKERVLSALRGDSDDENN